MSLSIWTFYTNSYSQCNTYSYSTSQDAKKHNSMMEYKDWLLAQLEAIKATPTDLSRVIEGDKLNQPTIQRILKGKTPNPRIGTIGLIEMALRKLGSPNPKYGHDDYIDSTATRIDEKKPLVLASTVTVEFQTPRDRQIAELVSLARSMSDEGLLRLLGAASEHAKQYPSQAKQTPGLSQ